jgi:hypothetical protein
MVLQWVASLFLSNAHLICFTLFRRRRVPLRLQGDQKVSLRTRRGSIKSTKTEIRTRIRIRIKSIKSTSTVIKTEVKIKTRRKRRIEVGIMILVLITQRNTMKRLANSLITTLSSKALGKL